METTEETTETTAAQNVNVHPLAAFFLREGKEATINTPSTIPKTAIIMSDAAVPAPPPNAANGERTAPIPNADKAAKTNRTPKIKLIHGRTVTKKSLPPFGRAGSFAKF